MYKILILKSDRGINSLYSYYIEEITTTIEEVTTTTLDIWSTDDIAELEAKCDELLNTYNAKAIIPIQEKPIDIIVDIAE